eukprot:c48026_g1_i1.p2 GENE.c48026_g1_i1~~c48026_g1_i1.p2  ORF type:complete len:236 (+),score=6.44 c48026_g1_i1:138-845(+)
MLVPLLVWLFLPRFSTFSSSVTLKKLSKFMVKMTQCKNMKRPSSILLLDLLSFSSPPFTMNGPMQEWRNLVNIMVCYGPMLLNKCIKLDIANLASIQLSMLLVSFNDNFPMVSLTFNTKTILVFTQHTKQLKFTCHTMISKTEHLCASEKLNSIMLVLVWYKVAESLLALVSLLFSSPVWLLTNNLFQITKDFIIPVLHFAAVLSQFLSGVSFLISSSAPVAALRVFVHLVGVML